MHIPEFFWTGVHRRVTLAMLRLCKEFAMPRRLSLIALALIACPALAQTGLPLNQGYFVAADTSCADASNATLQLVTTSEFSWPQQTCAIAAATQSAPGEIAVTLDCAASADLPAEQLNVVLTIPDAQHFGLSFAGEPPVFKTFCAQPDLPEPWRSNALPGGRD
jgi:hypothetical protein